MSQHIIPAYDKNFRVMIGTMRNANAAIAKALGFDMEGIFVSIEHGKTEDIVLNRNCIKTIQEAKEILSHYADISQEVQYALEEEMQDLTSFKLSGLRAGDDADPYEKHTKFYKNYCSQEQTR